MTKDVNVTELRQNLPTYLAKVRKGEAAAGDLAGQGHRRADAAAASKSESDEARERLRGSVLRFDRPTDPVFDPEEWDVNR